MEDLIAQIIAKTYRKNHALKRVRLLKEHLISQIFGSQSQIPLDKVYEPIDLQWLDSLPPAFFTKFNRDNVYQLIKQLEDYFNSVEALVIYIPTEFPESEMERIGIYVRENFGANFLIELKYDPTLIAGPAVVWKGFYHDYSIRQKILDNQKLILNQLRQYTRK